MSKTLSRGFRERRKSPHIRVSLYFRYRLPYEEEPGEQLLTTLDISSGGMAFFSTKPLPLPSTLEIFLDLPEIGEIAIGSRIIRLQEIERDSKYLVAVVFEDISEESLFSLNQFLNRYDISAMLQEVQQGGGSDLHLTMDQPPLIRRLSKLFPTERDVLQPEDLKRFIFSVMNQEQQAEFLAKKELDFSLDLPLIGRFLVNVHQQKGSVEAVFRVLSSKIKTIEELGLPAIMRRMAERRSGLVLVAGARSSGKSSSLTAMVDHINTTRNALILCVEDPIKFLHENKQSIIKQREVGSDTLSFSQALRHALRQDADVIMVGEIGDFETLMTCMAAAESGHLVLSSVQASNAVQSIEQLLNFSPPGQQAQTRLHLASTLRCILSQRLIPGIDPEERVLCYETFINTSAAQNMIRHNKTEQIHDVIQTSLSEGMISFRLCLKHMAREGRITAETFERLEPEFRL
jgi:twitching motility protein PilT